MTTTITHPGSPPLRVAMLGTRGVPARYGGFETAVEEIGARLASKGHRVTVYCRNPGQALGEHRGMRLINRPALRMKQAETLSHTALSVLHAVTERPDVAIVFNAANAPLLAVLKAGGVPTALHVDGLEWQRSKWSRVGKSYYLLAERVAVRTADRLIADSRAIADYYHRRYGANSTYIAYGAPILDSGNSERLAELHVQRQGYHLVVARMEPENNVLLAVQAHAQSAAQHPLVVVGGAPHAARYTAAVHAAADAARTLFVGNVWDQQLLDQLYAHALLYIHGHSVGGTNPSLLRAMGAAAPVAALDVEFNREVLGDAGHFFTRTSELARLVEDAEANAATNRLLGRAGQRRAADLYDWNDVADAYQALCLEIAEGSKRLRRSSTSR